RNRTLAEAASALAAKHPEIAEPLIARHLKKHPRDHEALNLMAEIARRAGRIVEAESLLARCLELSPDSAGYRYNYALVLRRQSKFEQALVQLDLLLTRESHNPLFRDQKASVLRILGRYAEALSYRKGLSEEFPNVPNVWLQYGHALRGAGSNEQC